MLKLVVLLILASVCSCVIFDFVDTHVDCSGASNVLIGTLNGDIDITCGTPAYLPGCYGLNMTAVTSNGVYACRYVYSPPYYMPYGNNTMIRFEANSLVVTFNNFNQTNSTITPTPASTVVGCTSI